MKQPGKITFETTLLQSGKTATGICVPADVVEKLAAGKKPPVKVSINNYTYRNTVATMAGVFMLSVSADVREKAGIKGGDKIKVEVELDTEPRIVTLPPDFQKALAKNAEAREFFETLSNSSKKRYVLPVEDAKTEETRNRRIEKAISDLRKGKK